MRDGQDQKRQNGEGRGKGAGQRLQRPHGGSRELGREHSKVMLDGQTAGDRAGLPRPC